MSLRPGDKVRFLDEKGEGTIIRFIDNIQVMVQMDDGFEIPYLLAKLVPAVAPVAKPQFKKELAETNNESYSPVMQTSVPSLQMEGVYLVYIPSDASTPMSGNFDVVLFNMTSLHIQITVASRHNGKFTCEYAGSLTPLQSCSIRKIQAEEIDRWSVLRIDMTFYSYSPYIPRDPICRLLKQKPARFYKENSFTTSGLTADRAITVDLTRNMQQGQEEEYFEEKDLSRIVFEKEQKVFKTVSRQSEKNNSALDWEVDLHIEELIDSISGLSNAQIIDIQLRHFQHKLDEGIHSNIRKIVFIHGVGNGRLKGEIKKILSTVKGIKVHDGSYALYGMGATEVMFH